MRGSAILAPIVGTIVITSLPVGRPSAFYVSLPKGGHIECETLDQLTREGKLPAGSVFQREVQISPAAWSAVISSELRNLLVTVVDSAKGKQ